MSDPLQHHGLQHARPPCHHQLPKFTQTHVHWVSDPIQPSHPLSSPSSPTLTLSQHQCLFQWVSSLYQVAKVLQLQHQSFQWIFRTDFLKDGLLGSPCCPRDSKSLLQCYSSKASILWCSWVLMFVRGLSGNIKWDLNSNLRFERHFLDININTVSFRFYKSGMWMRLPGEWV